MPHKDVPTIKVKEIVTNEHGFMNTVIKSEEGPVYLVPVTRT